MSTPPDLRAIVSADFDAVRGRVLDALAAEGFGVLTEADVAATLRTKLGVEVPRYEILGACNPPFARDALALDAEAGLLMPCNVVVRDAGGGRTEVLAVDPARLAEGSPLAELRVLAAAVRGKLARVIARLA